MARLTWTKTHPTAAGWYWYRGEAHEADSFIVEVDEVGHFQWPDGGFQEVSLVQGEWAGPIERPGRASGSALFDRNAASWALGCTRF